MIQKSSEIDENDRKLFSSAHKCKIGERRTAWRALSASLCKETLLINKPVINWYKENLEQEIKEICYEVIDVINPFLSVKSEKNIDKEK